MQWYGVLAPAGTPKALISRLHVEIVRVLGMADVRNQLSKDGAEPVGSSPGEFAAFVKSEVVKWAKVATTAGIKPE